MLNQTHDLEHSWLRAELGMAAQPNLKLVLGGAWYANQAVFGQHASHMPQSIYFYTLKPQMNLFNKI